MSLHHRGNENGIISQSFDRAQHTELTSHLVKDNVSTRKEEEETSLRLLGSCCAIAEK